MNEHKTIIDIGERKMDPSKAHFWAVVGHLGGLVPLWFFMGSVLIPLVIWLSLGDRDPFINRQAKEALNFQISLFIYAVTCMLVAFTVIGLPIAMAAWLVFYVTNIVCSIKGAVLTGRGDAYRYPLNLRLIK